MNPWEADALQYRYPAYGGMATSNDTVSDPIIYPGLYAPSGFDMMDIFFRVMSRPSPMIDLGPVDASCAVLMCDLWQPDSPIVYVNDACVEMTGYSQAEILGRNCRFMQAPGGRVLKSSVRKYLEKDLVKKMRRAVESNNELAIEVTNFKKNGQRFTNVLAMIPVYWDSDQPRYSVGFMAEKPRGH
ncbi:Uu.00g126760.m01.CDS01 [Anthostomella pinea]|uniref:Uu.00g126760.m01.CDS01 n=1 Tax=Anthostomella pinea TaxID=933095 RepID=A0AAI8YHY7_9PEZI|nr:Uu.00g126760.m01.CDS01 [Anthostomella pinea]